MAYSDDLKKFNRLRKRFKRNLEWENDEEKIRYYMSISPKEKLEWLRQIQKFLCSISPRSQKIFLRKLKEDDKRCLSHH